VKRERTHFNDVLAHLKAKGLDVEYSPPVKPGGYERMWAMSVEGKHEGLACLPWASQPDGFEELEASAYRLPTMRMLLQRAWVAHRRAHPKRKRITGSWRRMARHAQRVYTGEN